MAGYAEPASQDVDPLLPGEDPASGLPEDIAHWISVYLELSSAKAQIIKGFDDLAAAESSEVRAERERDDRRALSLQMARFQRRLRYWQKRQLELNQAETSPD